MPSAEELDEDCKGRVILIDDEVAMLSALRRLLGRAGFVVEAEESPVKGLERLVREDYDVALVDLMMPEMTGMDVLKVLRERAINTEVIIMTGLPTIERALEAVRAGAYDFLSKPMGEPEQVLLRIERAAEKRRMDLKLRALQRSVGQKVDFEDFVGRSPVMLGVFADIRRYAWFNGNVLIEGETGVGKELVALALYRNSRRTQRPFKAIACPTLREHLFESELFGHVKGSFTGAISDKTGLLETLNGGTLFLDEVGDLSLEHQAKLLRFMSTGEFSRVGEENITRRSDVRFLAATNKDLRKLIEEGKFRQDYYERFHFHIDVPPLRARREDIPHLAYHILRRLSSQEGREVDRISERALELLTAFPWKNGNVRELESCVYDAMTRADQGIILPEHLSKEIVERPPLALPVSSQPSSYPYVDELTHRTYMEAKKEAEIHFARYYFSALLRRHAGVVNKAATDADMDPPNLRKKLKEIHLDPTPFRQDEDEE